MTKAQCDQRRRKLAALATVGGGSPDELRALNMLDRAMNALTPFAEYPLLVEPSEKLEAKELVRKWRGK